MIKDRRFNGAFSGGSANPSGSAEGGVGGWRVDGLGSQTSGNAPISSDMMRGIMDGSAALFGNTFLIRWDVGGGVSREVCRKEGLRGQRLQETIQTEAWWIKTG